ncbi:MAG TPA: YgiT-type zinc finger protein [Tepidisphaeraceae bacterium]|jgi:YgiT-type zinc finger domain-containing protein|nr:YgiT-type zinc finger protein [Tepidisphaeraceae bacterium]
MSRTKASTCEFCAGRLKDKRVTIQHWFDGRLYEVEKVAAQLCQDCGERYYHAETLDAIDAMLRSKHPVEKRLSVEVVAAPS